MGVRFLRMARGFESSALFAKSRTNVIGIKD
jgi:hypothetical protein